MYNFHTIVVGKGDLVTLFYKLDEKAGSEVPHFSFSGYTVADKAGKKEVQQLLDAVVLLQQEARTNQHIQTQAQVEPGALIAFSFFGIRGQAGSVVVPALNTNWLRPGSSPLLTIARFEAALRYTLKRL